MRRSRHASAAVPASRLLQSHHRAARCVLPHAPPRGGNPATSLPGPSVRNAFPVSPTPGISSSRPLPPSVVAGHGATEAYSTDAVLEVHPSWPLPGLAPDPAMPREPQRPHLPPSPLLPHHFPPFSPPPAVPFSRDPRLSPAPRWAPPLPT